MTTSTLVLNFIGWAVLTAVVAAVSILIPLRLDRPSPKNTTAEADAIPRGETPVRMPVFEARPRSTDVRSPSRPGQAHGARGQPAIH
jgi:hypothetical protein